MEKFPPDFNYLKYYPAVGFYFSVSIIEGAEEEDGRFQSVTGLSVEVETESRKEGGENRFEHVLPVRNKFSNVVLKRGLIQSKRLRVWCNDTIYAITNLTSADSKTQLISPKDIKIALLAPRKNDQEEAVELMTWNIVGAWPKKWSISDLNAEQSSIAIETIEFQYRYFTIKDQINAH